MPSIAYGTEDELCMMCKMPMEFHWDHYPVRIPMPRWDSQVQFISEDDSFISGVNFDIMECHNFILNDGTSMSRDDLRDTLRLRGYL